MEKVNPDCTRQHRCGACRRDKLVEVQARIRSARIASRNLDGARICAYCGATQPLDSFIIEVLGRKSVVARCRSCQEQNRRELNSRREARRRLKPRKSRHKQQQQQAPTHPCVEQCGQMVWEKGNRCRDCYQKTRGTGALSRELPKIHACLGNCGTFTSKSDSYCRLCARQRQNALTLRGQQDARIRMAYRALETGTALALLVFSEEVYALSCKCTVCKKPILIQGRCYECATGDPVSITVRPEIIYSTSEASEAA